MKESLNENQKLEKQIEILEEKNKVTIAVYNMNICLKINCMKKTYTLGAKRNKYNAPEQK